MAHQEKVKRRQLVVRCYAEKKDGVWLAFCVDLSLGAQANSYLEVRRKLDAQITDYVHEACTIDRAHGAALLSRKAPLQYRLRYYWLAFKTFLMRIVQTRPKKACSFTRHRPVPMSICPA